MADRNSSRRRAGTGYGPGSKPTQFVKGKSGNPKGRRRRRREQGIDLRKVVMRKIIVWHNGKAKRVPYPVAHILRMMEKAAKGDPKADQSMFKLYKELGLFSEISADSEEPFEVTLKIGKVKNTILNDDADKSVSSTDGLNHDPHGTDENPSNGKG
jgi:uncharacterized protein DUF5681